MAYRKSAARQIPHMEKNLQKIKGYPRQWVRPVDMSCPFNQSCRQVRTKLLLHFFGNVLLPRNDYSPTVKFLATGFQWMQQCGKPDSQGAGISAESDFTLIVQTFASILGHLPVFRGQNLCPLHMEREEWHRNKWWPQKLSAFLSRLFLKRVFSEFELIFGWCKA